MLTEKKVQLLGCGLAASLLFSGCSGDDPEDNPTASATPTPAVAVTPTAPKTPAPNISPLGGKPATEQEKQYYKLQKKAENLVLAKSYKEAIPLLEQAVEQQPDDVENSFYLLLSHGSLEQVPSKGSAAYPYAKRVVELDPNSNEASRAKAYLVGAELDVAEDFKYGKDTFASKGGFVYDGETAYKLSGKALLHTGLNARLGKDDKATLWEAEVAPEMIDSSTLELEKGTEVAILSETHFFYSLTSWRKPLRAKPEEFDNNIFEINAFYVEVISDGDSKGKKGWLVNQIDRYLNEDAPDPWGTWVPDRLGLEREA